MEDVRTHIQPATFNPLTEDQVESIQAELYITEAVIIAAESTLNESTGNASLQLALMEQFERLRKALQPITN